MTTLTPVDGDPFAPPRLKLTPVEGDPFVKSTATGAFVHGAERGAAPALAGFAGFGAGFAGGGLLTAPAEAIPVIGTGVNAVGAVAGGIAGAFGAGWVVDKAQQKALSVLPTRFTKAIGQDPAQQAADAAQHPYASFSGELAPNLLAMRPGITRIPVAPGASRLVRTLAHPATGAIVGSTAGGGIEAGKELAETGTVDPVKVGIATVVGGLQNRPTQLGGKLFQAGGGSVIKAAQTAARTAGNAYRGTTGLGATIMRAAQDAADRRAGTLIDNPPQAEMPTPTRRALPAPKITPVEGDPFNGAEPTPGAPPSPPPAPIAPEPAMSTLKLAPVAGDPFTAPGAAPQPPEVSTPSPLPAVASQPVAGEPAAAGGDGLRPDPGPLEDGEQYVTTPAGNRIRSRFEVVPAASLQPATGDLQNRDRSRDTTDLQVQDIVANLDPERLGSSAETDRGAPIVGPDHTVESGNGRMLALNRIYSEPALAPQADAYRKFIADQGHATDGIENPILIRRRVNDFTPEQRRQFVIDSNKDAKLSMTSVERAKSDADGLDSNHLAQFRGGDVASAGNADFVKTFVGKLTPSERGSILDENRQLSQDGITRIENALLARAYEHPAILSKLTEARDNNIRAIGAGLLDNAGSWATLRAAIKDGHVRPEMDVTKQLVEAARQVSNLRANGGKVGDLLRQADIFKASQPLVDGFIRAFYNPELTRAASREAVTAAIGTYVRRASEQTTGAKLFGGGDAKPEDIINAILAERGEKHGGLFAVAAEDRLNPKGTTNVSERSPRGNEGAHEDRAGQGQEEASGRGAGEGAASDSSGRGRAGRGSDGEQSAALRGDEGLNETPDYTVGRSPLQDKGAYEPVFAERSFTNRTSIYDSAAVALGIDPDKFRLMPAPRQVTLLREAVKTTFGVEVKVDAGMQERFAIDQMLDAYQNVQGMAHVLDLPNMAISLGGALKLTLQKKGDFLGSFQPGATTITLPKRSNSFAHEWGHALDYFLLNRMSDESGRGLSGAVRKGGKDVMDEPTTVKTAFVGLLNAMFFDHAAKAQKIMELEAKVASTASVKVRNEAQAQIDKLAGGNSQLKLIRSAFYKGAQAFDGPSGEYWTSPTEMFARAFEAYVSYKAEANGLSTEFIGKGDAAYLSDADERFAKTFPKGEERAAIFAAFEDVLGHIADEQMIAKGPGAAKPDAGHVRRMTDYDRTPKVERERNVIKREVAAIKAELLHRKKAMLDRPESAKGKMELAADLNGATFMSMTGNLRMIQARTKSAGLQKLIDLLTKQDGRGDRTVTRTFAEDVHIQSKASINRLSNILKANQLEHLSIPDTQHLRDLLIGAREDGPDNMVKGAAAIRHLLDNEFYVNQQAGIDLGYTRSGYLARVLDLPKVYGDQKGFAAKATEVYGLVFDKAFGTEPADVLSDDKKASDMMKLARRLAKSHDLPTLAPVRAIFKAIKKAEAGDDPAVVASKVDKLNTDLADIFGDLIDETRKAYASDRAEAWLGKINLVAGQEHNAASPDSKYLKHRELPPETDKIMEKYYLSDPVESVTNYLTTSARRTAYARRFGNDGKRRLALFEQMAAEGVSPEDQITAERILDTATGRMRSNLPAAVQKALAFVNAAGTMALLPRATLSSLAEPFTSGLVTGDLRDGFKLVGMQIASALGSPNGKVRFELARAMGIVSDLSSDNIMEARYGQTYADTTRWDRYTAKMFAVTGLTALTRSQKTHAIGLGHAFLDNLAQTITASKGWTLKGAVENASALMRELGIRDPEAFAKEMVHRNGLPSVEDLDSDFGHDYTTAQLRFSKLVVQEPDAMDRPELAHNPAGRVIYGITGFSYAYWRNVIKRNINLLGEMGKSGRGGIPRAALYGSALIASAAVAYLMNLTISTIREKLLNPKRWDSLQKDGTLDSTMAELAFTRTFSFGAADTVIQTYSGLKYQRDFSNMFVGAGPSFILGNLQKMSQPLTSNSRTTNTAEFGFLQGTYSLASPFMAFGLARVPGGPLVNIGLGAGMGFATSPAARDAVATTIVGPKGGKKVGGGPTALDRTLDGVFGPVTKKNSKPAHNPYGP